MTDTIAIALSGGIDSLVSAFLLKQQGHRQLFGIHFITGFERYFCSKTNSASPIHHEPDRSNGPDQPFGLDELNRMISQLEDQLHFPIHIIDIRTEFTEKVVNYFIRSYQSGQTPNPCMVCNASIKFKTVLDKARSLGADRLATGHYVNTFTDESGKCHLNRGMDPVKDQSYFLAFLTQSQLSRACFPLGNMKKSEVVKLAKQQHLVPATRNESQDICFVPDNTYGDFLSRQKGFTPKAGPITDLNSKLLGTHKGLHLFTIGQRRGINCPAKEPYYVVRMEPKENRLVVGFKKDLLFSECRVTDVNWISSPPTSPVEVHTQVRYRHQAVPSILVPLDNHTVTIRFHAPLSSVTPGQGAVFYSNTEVLGGGWIESGK